MGQPAVQSSERKHHGYHYIYDSYDDNIIEKYNGLIFSLSPKPKIIQPIKGKEDIKTFTDDVQGNLLTESDETVSNNILTTMTDGETE